MLKRLPWLLATLLACTAFVAAGLWQHGRGVEKEAFLVAFEAALDAAPQPIDTALETAPELPRPVHGPLRAVAGAPWLLLDNSRRGAEVGLRAFAVYQSDADRALLVDFGWLPQPADRSLPGLPAPPIQLDGRGLLVALPGQGLRLGANPWPDDAAGEVLLTYLDLDEIAAAIGRPLHAGLLRLDPDLPVGFARDLDALPNTLSPEKHYGYAVQWFGFAAAVATIYGVLAFRNRRPTP